LKNPQDWPISYPGLTSPRPPLDVFEPTATLVPLFALHAHHPVAAGLDEECWLQPTHEAGTSQDGKQKHKDFSSRSTTQTHLAPMEEEDRRQPGFLSIHSNVKIEGKKRLEGCRMEMVLKSAEVPAFFSGALRCGLLGGIEGLASLRREGGLHGVECCVGYEDVFKRISQDDLFCVFARGALFLCEFLFSSFLGFSFLFPSFPPFVRVRGGV
jgi:hypothetical protein